MNEEANLFDGIPAFDAVAPTSPSQEGKGRRISRPHERAMLERMSTIELISHVQELGSSIERLESETSFLSWELRESQDNLAYFARATKFAHKLNTLNLDAAVTAATGEMPAYLNCNYGALYFYNIELMRLELVSASTDSCPMRNANWDNFLIKLFANNDYPYIAEYDAESKAVVMDDGNSVFTDIPPGWLDLLGAKVLILPLRMKNVESREQVTLGGMLLGNATPGLSAKDAEIAIIFADLLSSSLYNAQLLQRLNELTIIDPLTQIYNRRHLINQLESAMVQAQRNGHSLAIALIDIDFFKQFNDDYGHILGDTVLREVASTIKNAIRSGVDVPARYGGEEFVLIMPFTALDGAAEVCNRLRILINSRAINFEGAQLSVTCSIGVAEYRVGDSLEVFIGRADTALYQAKKEGRDRVCAIRSEADGSDAS